MGGWVNLESSWLAAAMYDGATNELTIRFKDKKTGNYTVTCRYRNVSPDTYLGLINASSHGEYFHKSGLVRRPYTIVAGK